MNRERRLRRGVDFQVVHRQGRSWSHPLVTLRALPNPLGRSRFGFMVSRRIGNAVCRNLVKRRLREIVRKQPVLEGWDLVFIARRGLSQATFVETTDSVRSVLRRSGLNYLPQPEQSGPQSSLAGALGELGPEGQGPAPEQP